MYWLPIRGNYTYTNAPHRIHTLGNSDLMLKSDEPKFEQHATF